MGVPEEDQWVQLRWETHRSVTKTKGGFTRCGPPFFVNRLTGESQWEAPPALVKHKSWAVAIEAKKNRLKEPAPTLDAFLEVVFTRHLARAVASEGGDGHHMSKTEFWKTFNDGEIHGRNWLSPAEREKLAQGLDSDGDGVVKTYACCLPYFFPLPPLSPCCLALIYVTIPQVSLQEFLAALVPLFNSQFESRGGAEWVALETEFEGEMYLYW